MNTKIIYLQAATKQEIIDDINNAYPELETPYAGEIEFPLPNGEALHYVGDIAISETETVGKQHCNLLVLADNNKTFLTQRPKPSNPVHGFA